MAHPLSFNLPTEPKGIEYLIELALDLRGTWEHAADELWGQLEPELWRLTLNPWAVLQAVSHAKLKALAADRKFRQKAAALVRARQQYLEAPTWFQRQHADAPLTRVAYFSMEFMLSEALPIYSGGLGNVAGDQLKSASDLGVPVVGVGLLYQQGYFRLPRRWAGPWAMARNTAMIRRGMPPKPQRCSRSSSRRSSRRFTAAMPTAFPRPGWRACGRAWRS